MTENLRVFVNGTGVSVPHGAVVLDAVLAADPDAAQQVREGARVVVDSRGLPVAPDTALSGGYVMRLVSSRQAATSADLD